VHEVRFFTPATPHTMRIQSILRRVHPISRFVYGRVEWRGRAFLVHVHPRRGCKGLCSNCTRRRPTYDTALPRTFAFVPLWGMPVALSYAMRRVDCPRCGVRVEMIPWATGKSQTTFAFIWFLASWAKLLAWKQVAQRFRTSWDTVYRAVEHAVLWGLENRPLDGVGAIGVDELAWKKGHKYMTLVYQIDNGCRRLLWIGKNRTRESFHDFFDMLGDARSKAIRFVASDMWSAFLSVVKKRASSAVHVLDRFHVAQLLSKAVDTVRRQEVRALRERGQQAVLTKTRWLLLKRRENLTDHQHARLRDLVRINLRSVRAYLLKEHFNGFWTYLSPWWAGRFLDRWTTQAMRSRLPPFKTFATTLRKHRELLLNWFRARGAFAHGATEGFNNKARITTRKAYGFRTYEHAETALYHALGDLPEPPWLTHRFC
jgi:transposase